MRSAYAYLNGALRFRLNGAANERKGQDCTHLADDIPVIQEPDAPIIQREWSERIQSLCGKLDPDDFEMLRLKFVENLSFQEVADVFEIAVSTLRVARIPRALRRARIVMNELNLDGVVSHEN